MSRSWKRLSLGRRLIGEVCHFTLRTPNGVMERQMMLDPVIAARAAASNPPSWIVLFAKAFALAAVEIPELRRTYVRLPFPGLYEHPTSVATITVEREVEGEPVPLFARLKHPELLPLAELDARLREIRAAPLGSVREFRYALTIARLPLPLRRLMWWIGLNRGHSRMTYFGSFGISVTAPFGAEVVYAVSPLSYLMTFGLIRAGQPTTVRMSFDHRITDGTTICRAFLRIETLLNTVLADELRAG